MKRILLILLLFMTSFSFSQELTLKLSKYPLPLANVMQDFKGVSSKELEVTVDNNKYVTKQKGGSFGYLSKFSNGSTSKSLWLHGIYKSGDRDKGVIVMQERGEKKYGSFKVKTSGSSRNTGLAFSTNGKYLVALGMEDDVLFAYQYNIATKKLEIKDLPIDMNKMPKNIYAVGSAGNGNYIYATDYDNGIIIIDLKSKKGKYNEATSKGRYYKYLFPSQISNHFLIANEDFYILCDGKTGQAVYSEDRTLGAFLPESFFVSAEGKVQHKINDKNFKNKGVGLVSTENSLVVFDQDFNFFTLANKDSKVDIFDYLNIKGNSDKLEPQPDLIPIIPDDLTTAGIKAFFGKTADICKKDNNRKLAYQVFESAEPFSDKLVSVLSQSSEEYVVEYVGKYVVQWINNTPKMELAEAGKSTNVNRKKFMDNYSKNLSQEEYGSYLADVTEIQNALEKLHLEIVI